MTADHTPFDPAGAADLPATIPVFPLTGALLLPRVTLPLNVFEPRYLALVNDSLAAGRMFGMIQPSESSAGGGAPRLYHTGCLGRITAFQEADDGRFLLNLRGVCRFHVAAEADVATPYRQVRADYAPFTADMTEPADPHVPRDVLLPVLRNYFERTDMQVKWSCIEQAPSERLVNYLAMICPFDSCEKQVLLEAGTIEERSRLLIRFLELAGRDDDPDKTRLQ